MRFTVSILFCLVFISAFGQNETNDNINAIKPNSFSISKPLIELGEEIKRHRDANDLRIKKKRRRKYTKDEALPIGEDPIWQ